MEKIKGIIKVVTRPGKDEDNRDIWRVHMSLWSEKDHRYKDNGVSYYQTRERMIEEFKKLKSHGWDVVVSYCLD